MDDPAQVEQLPLYSRWCWHAFSTFVEKKKVCNQIPSGWTKTVGLEKALSPTEAQAQAHTAGQKTAAGNMLWCCRLKLSWTGRMPVLTKSDTLNIEQLYHCTNVKVIPSEFIIIIIIHDCIFIQLQVWEKTLYVCIVCIL